MSTLDNIETAFPLSPLQQGMLFHSLGAPGTGVYVLQVRGELHGALNVRAFRHAWQRVLDRHQALRAAFVWEGVDEPMQVIGKRARLPFHYQDWRGLPARQQARRLDAWVLRDRVAGFRLSRAPLTRVLLVRLDAERHALVWTLHHLIADGWSRPVLVGEVTRCYRALAYGEPLALPPARAYRDYVARLPRDLAPAERFWRAQLEGVTQPTPLGVDRPAAARVVPEGHGRGERRVTAEETTSLESWARRHGLSLGSIVTAAWAIVLSRYTGEPDVLFGVTVSGRSAAADGFETLVGLCINTLPLRARIAPDAPLVDWLRTLQRRYAALREYEHAPLARIQQWSSVTRGLPLFESIVVFENFPVEAATSAANGSDTGAPPLDLRHVDGFDKTNFALTLIADPGAQLSITATYDPARFDPDTIDRLLGHITTVLRGMTSGEAATLGDLPLLTPVEREQIVGEWNATARRWTDEETSTSLVAWLEAQAARTPGATAVWAEDERWTYAELHARANRIARRLRRLGVGAESRVGVWIPRSPMLVAALVGVVKAGGAYVPFDPGYPAARLAFQAEDAAVQVLLTTMADAASVPAGPYVVEVLDAADAAWRQESPDAPPVQVSPEQLAYVIYTSGSTGRPKGAMNTHRGIGNRLAWMQATYALGPADRVLQKTSSSFDVSVWEFFWPLGTGATLVVAKPGGHQDPAYLADVIARAGVTVLHFVPAVLEAFVTARGLDACRGVRLIVASGEALPGPLVARCLAAWPGRLDNLYGPTEAAIDVTWQPCTPALAATGATIPIGRPVANTQVYVRDGVGQPAPVGVSGELYLGGVQVGRGYWRRPDLTAERFVPDPFGAPGARLYRTGDLARYRADGAIEYVGRVDHQVKLHGNRIELGEIDAVLRQHAGVRDAAVVLREDAPDTRRLVAYVVPAASPISAAPSASVPFASAPSPSGPTVPAPSVFAPPAVDAWRQHLRLQLPEYMIPSAFVILDALPLTPSGKVDRRALPAPSGERPDEARAYTAPRTGVETTIAEVWAEVLRLTRVGIHDNFFSLGGDSMRTIQVQAKARDRGLAVTLEQLMRHQTIQELARQLELASGEPTSDDAASDKPAFDGAAIVTRPFDLVSAGDRARLPADVEDAYPLTELQAGMLFHSELSPESSIYHDALSYHLRAPFDPAALETAVAEVVAAHPVLRTSIRLAGYDEPLQLVHRDGDRPLVIHDFRQVPLDEQDARLAAWFDAARRARFDWTKPPLFRLHVHRRTDQTLQCTLLCHHAILDGWSVATLLTELFRTYLARGTGSGAPALSAPADTLRDYVALERAAVQDERARDYWLTHLAGSAPTVVPRWPAPTAVGESREARDEGQFESRSAMLAADVVAGLNHAAGRAGVPLKSLLLAVHLRVLGFAANQRDVVSGLVMHGRTGGADADRVLGLFLNTTPLRCDVETGSWLDLARRVFDVECGHLRFRHFPMPTLQRLMGGQPLFDAAFNFMHFHVYQALADLRDVEVLGGASRTDTNFPLLAHCTLRGSTGDIEVRLDANRAALPGEQVERLLEYYLRACEAVASDPDRACAASLISPAEREQVLATWNATDQRYPADRCVQDLIATQVRATPDAVAVIDGERHITYRTFWRRAEALAASLRRLGVVPDTCVGLCLPRSLEMMVAVLATMEAGGAYVPFDPAYPDERLALMAGDAAVRVLLTTRALAPRFAHLAATVVCLDDVGEATAEATAGATAGAAAGTAASPVPVPVPAAAPVLRVDPRHLAYVMYTSGSTGRPKGIGLTHACLTNLIAWHLRVLGGAARTLQFASLSFDASFHEMAAAWCAGGTLYLVPEPIRADSQALARDIQSQALEKVILPPVVLQQLAEHCGHTPALFGSLRQIITTGEQLRLTQPVVDLLAALPDCTLHNHYGPAETHVVTAMTMGGPPASWSMLPPVGPPIDNTQIYLLDRRFDPVPVGTPGELFIGGVSLARGYYHRPDLTAERFVPDPFGPGPLDPDSFGADLFRADPSRGGTGGRLYRTGDLARWLPNGDLEFLGRIANRQVKIRGFRIELSEVEAALGRHPGVRNAVVVLREYAPDDRRLVAYLIPAEATAPGTSDLRAFMARVLPEFMLPSAFVVLDAFPLTPNGKIDRRMLPDPMTHGRPDLAAAFVAPRTAAESLVAAIYTRVLRIDRLGVEDSFFERGGHSLLATQAIVRLREAFGLDVPLPTLFERPTVAGMVEALGALLGDRATLDEIAGAILEVEALSDDEVQARLAAERTSATTEYSHLPTI